MAEPRIRLDTRLLNEAADGGADESSAATTPAMTAPVARKSYADYFGAAEFRDVSLPPPGTQLWYRRRSDGKWIHAIVVDPVREGLDEPMGYGTLHLAVDLADDYRRTSPEGSDEGQPLASSPLGWRQNVVAGTERGEWQMEKPDGADEAYEREQARKAEEVAVRRQMAHEGGLMATHRGKLPKGVK